MTREAKIGLLVALAFILVIGILLSDHVTSATREPPANLGGLAGSIGGSTSTPGGAPAPQTAPRLPETAPPVETTPYVHGNQAGPADGGEVAVRIGVPQNPVQPQPLPLDQQQVAQNDQPAHDPWANPDAPAAPGAGGQPTTTLNLSSSQPGPLQDAAREMGEELIPVGPGGQAPAQPEASTPMAGVREYTIQSGDSLSKITARFLGRYTPANEEIILALNPKLKANPNRIIVGEKCMVPATASAVENLRAASSTTGAAPQQRAASTERPPQAQRPAGNARTYTVKKGDTLWSIAASQLGSGARHKEILSLNKDKLSSADALQVGMKLKLPS